MNVSTCSKQRSKKKSLPPPSIFVVHVMPIQHFIGLGLSLLVQSNSVPLKDTIQSHTLATVTTFGVNKIYLMGCNEEKRYIEMWTQMESKTQKN